MTLSLMKQIIRFDSQVLIYEFDPAKNPSQIIKAEGTRKPLRDFKHTWYRREEGLVELSKINLTTFQKNDINSIHYGWLFWDSGHELNHPYSDMITCYLTKPDNNLVVTDSTEKPKQPIWWGVSLLFALVVDGKKNLLKAERFAHRNSKVERTMLGQKADKTVILATSKGLTGDQAANVMLELGCVTAVMCDGGQSAQMQIGDKHYGGSRPLGTVLAVMGKEEVKEVVKPSDKNPILIIDPGHGGKDPGGGSSIFYDPNGFYEKNMVLDISLYQYERFRELGVSVALTRKSDVYLSPEERTNIVKRSGAKYCFSNHVNAASDPKARGAETIHSIFSSGKTARALLDAIVSEGMTKRRAFFRPNSKGLDWYFMHRLSGNVETTIVEFGFATNETDAKLLVQHWQKYAESNVKAFCQLIGHSYIPPSKPEPSPAPDIPLNRLIVDSKQIGAYKDSNALLANIEIALGKEYKEILIQKV